MLYIIQTRAEQKNVNKFRRRHRYFVVRKLRAGQYLDKILCI